MLASKLNKNSTRAWSCTNINYEWIHVRLKKNLTVIFFYHKSPLFYYACMVPYLFDALTFTWAWTRSYDERSACVRDDLTYYYMRPLGTAFDQDGRMFGILHETMHVLYTEIGLFFDWMVDKKQRSCNISQDIFLLLTFLKTMPISSSSLFKNTPQDHFSLYIRSWIACLY